MKHLVLIRHAKSSVADPTLEDRDRPLNERGRLAAPIAGAWLAERALRPDHVFLSPALRCTETWARVARQFDTVPEPVIENGLYMADPATMLEVLHGAPDAAQTVFMLGHQPGLASFLRRLANRETPARCARAFTKFPTAGIAVMSFGDGPWAETGFNSGQFEDFAVPKELV
ncbi:histidine phosphatase family protein [Oceanicella sp. SM1341]|uniref:SixA phosphatase family protein n=1 Tax=Oceanicella sp. SM1341 TaxID=1548889 RepID=UPI000E50761A|nr:histidine phosphatase family protein [Oceanicella sp. SM1341]